MQTSQYKEDDEDDDGDDDDRNACHKRTSKGDEGRSTEKRDEESMGDRYERSDVRAVHA